MGSWEQFAIILEGKSKDNEGRTTGGARQGGEERQELFLCVGMIINQSINQSAVSHLSRLSDLRHVVRR